MNDFVRETICHALTASNEHYEQTFKGSAQHYDTPLLNSCVLSIFEAPGL